MKLKNIYFAEVTDTYGGEANYCWVRRYLIKANTQRGAIGKLSKLTGFNFRIDCEGETSRYNAQRACICAFLTWDNEGFESEHYPNIETI